MLSPVVRVLLLVVVAVVFFYCLLLLLWSLALFSSTPFKIGRWENSHQ